MRCPCLYELPPPPPGKTGWPWNEESPQTPNKMPDGREWPRISIVTPSFNQADFIEETIRSVLLQGYPDLEYFVIDGGSTDGSVEIIRRYAPWLAGWGSEKDRGQSHAINKGFERCTGNLITFQNSDDFYLPGALFELGRLYSHQPQCGAVVGAFANANGSSKLDMPVPPQLHVRTPADLTLGPPGVYRLHQVSTIYTRRALDSVGRHVDEQLKYVMDRELLYRVCKRFSVQITDVCVAAFRRHAGSKTVSQVVPFADEFAQLYLMHLDGSRDDVKRRRMARHHTTKGFIRAAKSATGRFRAARWLANVPMQEPKQLASMTYAKLWAKYVLLRNSVGGPS